MKKIIYLFLLILLTFSFSTLVSSEVTGTGKIKKDTYATSEDILISLIEPDINRIIKEKYGQQRDWEVSKISKVGLIADHTKEKSEYWYQMKLGVRIENDLDLIDIRIDIPNLYTENRYNEENSRIKVSLIEYAQIK
ncbi:DUF3888 domain-containing protein [Psychrobacillus psychrodurans]|uniref:DUF3888 domain-containing protein n=1 Tax=Psychrobacillus psychrodurans TaxID=126157 RepID=UPI001F4D8E62|nr:DUF3888 domain-containing protein [Psychrobacillus psychrodurans]MCK1998941.1 DUF3888 domain-containing protein [Psychrobacillus psychrodurans]